MKKSLLLLTLSMALLLGGGLALWLTPGREARLARQALSDDSAVRSAALRALVRDRSDEGRQPRLLADAVLRHFREDDRLARSPAPVFADVLHALAAADAAKPATIGYPAFGRELVRQLGEAEAERRADACGRVGAEVRRGVGSVTAGNAEQVARLAAELAEAPGLDDAACLHHLLLSFATLAGPDHAAILEPLLARGLASGDGPLIRDSLVLLALLEARPAGPMPNPADPPPEARPALWFWRARLGEPRADAPALLRPLLDRQAAAAPDTDMASPPLLPPSPEPTLELAYWPVPRWEIALRVEQAADADLARALLRDLDDHVRRAGLLACALVRVERERIARLAEQDDDLTNRRYALLAQLMSETDQVERDRLAEAAIALAETRELPADDVLFALLAAGSTRGGDWLFDPLTPRRDAAASPLGWRAELKPAPGTTIWPILVRFLGPTLALPANRSDDPDAARLHADALRLAWLVHRRHLRFDPDARTFRKSESL